MSGDRAHLNASVCGCCLWQAPAAAAGQRQAAPVAGIAVNAMPPPRLTRAARRSRRRSYSLELPAECKRSALLPNDRGHTRPRGSSRKYNFARLNGCLQGFLSWFSPWPRFARSIVTKTRCHILTDRDSRRTSRRGPSNSLPRAPANAASEPLRPLLRRQTLVSSWVRARRRAASLIAARGRRQALARARALRARRRS